MHCNKLIYLLVYVRLVPKIRGDSLRLIKFVLKREESKEWVRNLLTNNSKIIASVVKFSYGCISRVSLYLRDQYVLENFARVFSADCFRDICGFYGTKIVF